jgi:hypothetical protein
MFVEYYNSVSTCFESDKAFEQFVTSVWSIDKLYYEKKKRFHEIRHIKRAPESESGEESRAEKKAVTTKPAKPKTTKKAQRSLK